MGNGGIILLTPQCYFVTADRQEKADRKKAKADAAKARREEEERLRRDAEEKERIEKETKEAAEKKKAEAEKREKDAQKKALKKERRELRNMCKEHDFYCLQGTTAGDSQVDERVHHMTELDKLCEILAAVELEALNSRLKAASDKESGRIAFREAFNELNVKLEKEKMEAIEKAHSGSSSGSGQHSATKGKGDWSTDELGLLIKAVNLFPAGTNQRWEVVASFINQHTKTPSIQRGAKETLSKAKELQSGDFHLSTLKEEANKRAYENLEKQTKKRDVKVSYCVWLVLPKMLPLPN